MSSRARWNIDGAFLNPKENRPKSGRPKRLNEAEIRSIVRNVRKNPTASDVKISEEISQTSGINVSASTVRRALNANGLHGRAPRRKPLISKVNQKRRLDFAKKYRNHGNQFWNNTIFTDEIEAVKRKWANMRDYFVLNQTKKSTGKPATATKRDESMMFLLDTFSLKRSQASITYEVSPTNQGPLSSETYIDLSSEIEVDQSELDTIFERESIMKDGTASRSSNITSSSVCTDGRASSLDLETPQRRQNKRRAPSSDPTTLRTYFMSQAKTSGFFATENKTKGPFGSLF
ncbi:uncharacterized protein LOC119610115 [Lucilia sericata]|uniref:uncharacterized protein LOC119610115 n=1 Tax=Lucilia sericata TaxID=13632 RepID=UPI0018A82296|nr:uncharacterized protein LOC119610115 [Lucilia sericata]